MLRGVCIGAQVKRLKESRLSFRGDGDQDPVTCEDKARHIVPTALVVRVQRLRDDLYNAVEGPSTRPFVLSMITGSYFRRPKAFDYFRARRDEIRFAFDPP